MQGLPVTQTLEAFRRIERFRAFDWVSSSDARLIVLRHNQTLVRASTRAPLLVAPEVATNFTAAPVFLGLDDSERALFLLELERDVEDTAVFERLGLSADDDVRFADPMTQLGRLAGAERELLLTALALARWSAEHRFCNACGAPLHWDVAAWTKTCTRAIRPHRIFPRLDPATIMLVHAGDRVLLGRQKTWPDGVYSTLAGFVEPGETVEAAVAREVREEAGIHVEDVRYFASEAWPFPRSLMLGYFARARDFDVRVGEELDDARWFSRAELRELYARVSARMPHFDTIARRLMLAWLDGNATSAKCL